LAYRSIDGQAICITPTGVFQLPHEIFLGDTSDIDDLCDGIVKLRENIDELTA
jgi:hypothetical protein